MSTASPFLQTASDSDQLRKDAAVIKERLDRCLSEHLDKRCAIVSNAVSPKRLIELDSSGVARLVPTPSPLPQYVILSYAWGPEEDNLQTLSSNADQMHAGIPSSKLPLTLQHVFQLVDNLSLSYLWVDALCIVQDDDVEKATEIVNMSSTYSNAFLQIAATSSLGARHGLYASDDDGNALSLDEHHLIMKACRSLRQHDWDTTLYDHYRLLTRGWTFQERLLARRCVHFTKNELVWECKSARWCECEGIGDTMGSCGLINNMSSAVETCRALLERDERRGKVSPLWRECVMSYSKRNLGRAEDRLVAISGIALLLQPAGGDKEYLAGMWEEAMPFDLLWKCDQTSKFKERKMFRPSWSWASVHYGVSWPKATNWMGKPNIPPSEGEPPLDLSLVYLTTETYFEVGLRGVPVRNVEVKPFKSRFGLIESATVILTSRKIRIDIRKRREQEDQDKELTDWVVEREGSTLPFYRDVEFTDEGHEVGIGGCEEYWFVEIATAVQDEKIWEAGLVVRQAIGQEVAYERVGMAGCHVCEPTEGPQWFRTEPEDIVLI